MLGYVEFYFKLINSDEIAYAKFNSDFTKDITNDFYEELKNIILKDYNKLYNKNFEIFSCSKEEYENYKSNDGKRISWNGDDYKIEQIN